MSWTENDGSQRLRCVHSRQTGLRLGKRIFLRLENRPYVAGGGRRMNKKQITIIIIALIVSVLLGVWLPGVDAQAPVSPLSPPPANTNG